MKIERRFTTAGQSPYAGIDFSPRTTRMTEPDGRVVFECKGFQAPSSWSQVATDILSQKYFRRAGVPDRTEAVDEPGVPEWLRRRVPAADAVMGGETDARQVFDRLAGHWTYWGWTNGYFETEEDASAFHDEVRYMLAKQMAAPNSPQFFNVGRYWAYGFHGSPNGAYAFDPRTGEPVLQDKSAFERPQLSACFLLSLQDDLVNPGGIMDLWVREARVFRGGGGAGVNVSELRATGEPLSGGGKTSGLMSWLKIGDRAAGGIASGGAERRAALMRLLNDDHPDLEKFVTWKVREERKVAMLMAGSKLLKTHLPAVMAAITGYQAGTDAADPEAAYDPDENPALGEAIRAAVAGGVPENYVARAVRRHKEGYDDFPVEEMTADWQGEAYNTVSGQNSNNSIRVTNAFLKAVKDDADWHLYGRVEKRKAKAEGRPPKPVKTLKARYLWDLIAESAWECADPGIVFHDLVNDWATCPNDSDIRTCNPCSEYHHNDDTACNLSSLNLVKFYDADRREFLVSNYEHVTRLFTIVLDISVGMAAYPSPEVARGSWKYRTLGLGYANLGALLMRMGLPYDSDEGRAVAAAVTAIMHCEAYATSARLAADLGPYPRYEANKEPMLRVVRNHRRAVKGDTDYESISVPPQALDATVCPAYLRKAALDSADMMVKLGEEYGFRNSQVSLIAPTGTISLLMDCDTSGCEPDFALVKFKSLAGGGHFTLVNQSVPPALKGLGYTESQIQGIVRYAVGTRSVDLSPVWADRLLPAFKDGGVRELDAALKGAFALKYVVDPVDTGLSQEEFAAAEREVLGTGTLEGAPHLKPEHYPVFDCANKCGRTGTRFLSWESHVKMLAAIQPFLSGSSSKTVNIPYESTVDDVQRIYETAHRLMVKAVALYRDGSKLSQPLSSVAGSPEAALIARAMAAAPRAAAVEELVDRVCGRKKLPDRRAGYTQKARVGGQKVYVQTGEYADGTLGEIWLTLHKQGAAMQGFANALAVAVSLGLQHGVPLEEYVDAFVHTRFEPAGPVIGNPHLKRASSVVDYLFRELAVTYLGRHDLAQVPPAEDDATPAAEKPVSAAARKLSAADAARVERILEARQKGYEAEPCGTCGALACVRNGACLKCTACGETSGCS